ncbi:MAG TPA: signal peptidase I [Polyangiaceae bacterium]|nr:signal peptidase I [Polyangiaceae bacterium]
MSCFWLLLVPAALASAASYLIVSSPVSALGNESAFEVWLQDQVLLVWLATFVAASAILRYWQPLLPPKHFWGKPRAASAGDGGWEVARNIAWVAGAMVAALVLRSLVAEPAKVRSISMLPSLNPGDLLVVSKWSQRSAALGGGALPQRGRAILFDTPDPAIAGLEPQLFKRVIGLPGDVLTVEQGGPVINGWPVPRCKVGLASFDLPALEASTGGGLVLEWLGDETYLTLLDGPPVDVSNGPYTVKPGEVWVLGDNRNRSSDSRNWFDGKGGGVPLASVRGYPTFSLLNTLGETRPRFARLHVPTLPEHNEALAPELARCLAKKPARTTPPPTPHEKR